MSMFGFLLELELEHFSFFPVDLNINGKDVNTAV